MAKMMRRKDKRTLYHFDQAVYEDNPSAFEVFELLDSGVAEDEPTKLDQEAELLKKAKALGIKANRSWGIPKLEAAIAAAENTTESNVLSEADLDAVDGLLAEEE